MNLEDDEEEILFCSTPHGKEQKEIGKNISYPALSIFPRITLLCTQETKNVLHHHKPPHEKAHNLSQISKLFCQINFYSFEGKYSSKIKDISNVSEGKILLASPGISSLLKSYNHKHQNNYHHTKLQKLYQKQKQ